MSTMVHLILTILEDDDDLYDFVDFHKEFFFIQLESNSNVSFGFQKIMPTDALLYNQSRDETVPAKFLPFCRYHTWCLIMILSKLIMYTWLIIHGYE